MKKLFYGLAIFCALLGIFLIAGGANLFYPSPLSTKQNNPVVATVPVAQSVLLIEPESGARPIIDAINQTTKSIDLTIYTISDSNIINALISAQKRGVAVRVLYNDKFFSGSGQKTNQQTISLLVPSGIKTQKTSTNFTLTHQKSFILDDNRAIIMTFNLEPSYFSTSRDFAIITTDLAVISEIKAVFEADWLGQKISPNNPALVWSPDNSRVKLKKLIDSANKTLEVYAMELQDDEMMNTLISVAKRGVTVRIISAKLWNNGVDGNDPWRQALNEVGATTKIDSLFTHAKVIVADYGTQSQIAYIGSINFSANSLDKNRELGILTSDQSSLNQLEQIFNEDWKLAN